MMVAGDISSYLQPTNRATVLTHPENKGKGEGLKQLIATLKKHTQMREVAIVTADSDGQHSPEDIVRIANRAALEKDSLKILGVRNFDASQVPLREAASETKSP